MLAYKSGARAKSQSTSSLMKNFSADEIGALARLSARM